ncbi:hypothetical protein B7486_09140 [cyanobacterium TDX16]|nr:hypothetical protein B7486_09140 [cyanobacterium TDX16]
MQKSWFNILVVAVSSMAAIATGPGCAGPGPKLAPVAPLESVATDAGEVEYRYDMNDDGKPDYAEVLNADGRIHRLQFDTDNDGVLEAVVDRLSSGSSEGDRQLVVLLDSIPYGVVREAWQAGRFRLFPPPSRVISPFPVMTDLSFSEFFGVSPSPGAESEYYDGNILHGGYDVYAAEGNAGWIDHTDYHLQFIAHAVAYLWPDIWYGHELGKIQRHFFRGLENPFVGYVVTTSGLGATQGRNGHQSALVRLDRFCQAVMFEMRGRVQITLMSDHGHCLLPSKRIPLSDLLKKFGYRITSRLRGPGDVVVPEFGVVNFAGVYTKSPDSVARDLIGVDGIELTTFLDTDDAVVVQSRDGLARIRRSVAGDGYRYDCEHGDPLQLLPVVDALRRNGEVGPDGSIADDALFDSTKDHLYPDALHRLWRAFHGLMVNPPDVMISVQDGWHCGSALMTKLVDVSAAHGSLNADSSGGFVMTTNGPLPQVIRMEALRAELVRLGINFRKDPSDETP